MRGRAYTNAAPADPKSGDYFRTLIDSVNQHLLTQLSNHISGDAYLLAFVRGSLAESRLEIARGFWPAIVELFELDEVIEDLERAYGRFALDDALSRIKRVTLRGLLGDRGRLGASKLLLRLKKPDDKLFSRDNYTSIETFISEVSTLSQDCDESVKDIFAHADLGEARGPVREQFRWLLIRFEFRALVDCIDAHFEDIVQIHRDVASLHPALPIAEAAVSRIADRLGIHSDIARQVTTLLRLAWICRLKKPEDFSDLSIKAIVLIPQGDTSPALQAQAQEVLGTAACALTETIRNHADLQHFHATYPDVRIGAKGFVMSLPKVLFQQFLGLDSGKKQLDFITKYRMGQAYFQKYLLGNLADEGRSLGLDLKDRDHLNSRFASMTDRIIYIKAKSKGSCVKTKELVPMNITPHIMRGLLENAVLSRDHNHTDRCSRILNKVDMENLFGKIRGRWTVKKG
jgi:hypothetical protein